MLILHALNELELAHSSLGLKETNSHYEFEHFSLRCFATDRHIFLTMMLRDFRDLTGNT